MKELMKAIDTLPDEEFAKVAHAWDEMEKAAENRVNAINTGRYFAREFAKHASEFMQSFDEGVSRVPKLGKALTKMASEGKSVLAFMASGADREEATLEKLATPEYYRSCSVAFAKMLDLFFGE